MKWAEGPFHEVALRIAKAVAVPFGPSPYAHVWAYGPKAHMCTATCRVRPLGRRPNGRAPHEATGHWAEGPVSSGR